MSKLFISCVDLESNLPSGKLAKVLTKKENIAVTTLFQDSRRFIKILTDAIKLIKLLRQLRPTEMAINVNGSHIRLLIAFIAIIHRLHITVIIMDVYPQCLRHVTRYWYFFYFPFMLFEFIALSTAKKIVIIDEHFETCFPINKFRYKTSVSPIDFLFEAHDNDNKRCGILLCGNIEERFLHNNSNIQLLCNLLDQNLIVATSKFLKTDIARVFPDADIIAPWPKEKTDEVMSQCKYMYIPLSASRVVFSSPSKIIDCYSHGIIPIIDCDIDIWITQKYRHIYRGAVHVTQVAFQQKKGNILLSSDRSLLTL